MLSYTIVESKEKVLQVLRTGVFYTAFVMQYKKYSLWKWFKEMLSYTIVESKEKVLQVLRTGVFYTAFVV